MNLTSNSPLDKHALLAIRTGLREQQSELRQIIEKDEREIRTLADPSPLDSMDAACSNASRESMFARNSQNRRRLRLVELALERMGKGEFGICDTCGEAIGLKRLQAVPWAGRCIQCQQQSEQGRPAEGVSVLAVGSAVAN